MKRSKAANQEIREMQKRIAVVEGYLAAIKTNEQFPDMTQRLINEHREKIAYHELQIRIIEETSAPRPERVAELERALAKSKRKLAELKNTSMIEKMLRMQRDLNALSAELGKSDVDDGDVRDAFGDADDDDQFDEEESDFDE